MILAFIMMFITGYSGIVSRFSGPLVFGLSAFLPLGVGLFVLLFFSYALISKYPSIALVCVFSGFLLKYVMPYYVFDGYVNYDTPIHYLSALYLRDYGLSLGYHYHSWPSSLFLSNIFATISGFSFPYDYSLIALTSRFLIPLSVYLISKRFLASSKSVLIAMAVLLIFEPYIIHPCPQITAVALTTMALMVFISRHYREKHGWLYVLAVLGVSIVTYHAIMPIALALSILAVLLFYDLIPRLGFTKSSRLTRYKKSRMWLMVIILVAIVAFYITYITPSIMRSIVKVLTSIIQGKEARLDVYPLSIESSELKWQYYVIGNIRRVAVVLLLGIPSVIVALSLLTKYIMSRLSVSERVFLDVAIIASINALIYIVFGKLLNVGLVGRFYQLSYILSPILTAYFYENLSNISSQNSSRNFSIAHVKRAVSIIVLVSIFVFTPLSIFTSPPYIALYIDAFGKPELTSAQWIAEHLSASEVHLDGSIRLNQLIALYLYPNNVYRINLSITRYMEIKALKEDYSYTPGTIITTRKPLSTGASVVKGLSDAILARYIEKIPIYFNKLFSNDCCEIFMSR